MQSSSRIDQDYVKAFAPGPADGIEGQSGRICAQFAFFNRRIGALTPDRDLFDSRRTKCVASDEQDFFIRFRQRCRDLAKRRCFARSIDPDKEDDFRFGRCSEIERAFQRRERFGYGFSQSLAYLFVADLFVKTISGEAYRNARRGCRAQISGDKHIFQIVNRVLVELAFGENRRDILRQFF